MGTAARQAVVGVSLVIVSPKKPPAQLKFRWDPDLVEEVRRIAERTGRSVNETAEMLVRWAVERSKAELERSDETRAAPRRKKTQG